MFRFVSFTLFFLISAAASGDGVADAVKSVVPRIVRIETIGGHEKVGREIANDGTTTGILLDQEGFIITGSFNILHDPNAILVLFSDGTKKTAKKIAVDRLRMLTLLKTNDFSGQEMPPIPYREKKSVRIGEACIAVGESLSPSEPNVALGVISGKDRIWGKALQTDAAVGPNNYGGPLIDSAGKILGILVPLSSMSDNVAAGAEMYDAGVGMAVPFEDILPVVPKLKEGKDLLPGAAGFSFKENKMFVGDAVIDDVMPESAAAKAGLKKGDKITKIDDSPVTAAMDAVKNVRRRYAGETLKIAFLRDGTEQTVSLTTEERKEKTRQRKPRMTIKKEDGN
ncbi:MAG: S1C family serine protease [Planctomycetaceae bacterium]|nr:S1C family serine protease [Planctomycetaceae bacterium]